VTYRRPLRPLRHLVKRPFFFPLRMRQRRSIGAFMVFSLLLGSGRGPATVRSLVGWPSKEAYAIGLDRRKFQVRKPAQSQSKQIPALCLRLGWLHVLHDVSNARTRPCRRASSSSARRKSLRPSVAA
jgi:hypothetical protein